VKQCLALSYGKSDYCFGIGTDINVWFAVR